MIPELLQLRVLRLGFLRDGDVGVGFVCLEGPNDGKDRRRDALVDRKLELRRMIGRFSRNSRLQYADHVEESGTDLFRHVCELDLEGIVAKPKHSPYAGPD